MGRRGGLSPAASFGRQAGRGGPPHACRPGAVRRVTTRRGQAPALRRKRLLVVRARRTPRLTGRAAGQALALRRPAVYPPCAIARADPRGVRPRRLPYTDRQNRAPRAAQDRGSGGAFRDLLCPGLPPRPGQQPGRVPGAGARTHGARGSARLRLLLAGRAPFQYLWAGPEPRGRARGRCAADQPPAARHRDQCAAVPQPAARGRGLRAGGPAQRRAAQLRGRQRLPAARVHGHNVPQAEKSARFDEALAIVLRAWSGERFSYSGQFHSIADVQLQVRPVQQPCRRSGSPACAPKGRTRWGARAIN